MSISTVTLHSMLLEMGTWIPTSAQKLEKARESGITTRNNQRLKSLVSAWTRGDYDECPESLHQSLVNLIP